MAKEFIVDHGLAYAVVEHLPSEDWAAVLQCWRTKHIEALDEVVERVQREGPRGSVGESC